MPILFVKILIFKIAYKLDIDKWNVGDIWRLRDIKVILSI